MKTSHTPGPWVVSKPMADGQDIVGIEVGAETSRGHLSVAWVLLGKKPTQTEIRDGLADAQVLAAAPTLLSAAKRMVEAMGADAEHTVNGLALMHAIAKAEGRVPPAPPSPDPGARCRHINRDLRRDTVTRRVWCAGCGDEMAPATADAEGNDLPAPSPQTKEGAP